MKLRKLLMCLLASMTLCAVTGIHTYAAEITDIVNENEASVLESAEATEEQNVDMQNVAAEDQITEEVEKETEEIEEESTTEDKDVKKDKVVKKNETKKKIKKTTEKAAAKAVKETKEDSYTKEELRLLACLISCEAGGEPYAGKLAVGIVVVNRKESKLFPGTIKGVIYQSSQFGPARNGSLARALSDYDEGRFNSEKEKDCIEAAKEALQGVKEVTYNNKSINLDNFLYFSGRVSGAKLSIANHQFK
ncbi:MAG: cell wall hydrolase [Acetivibrio sp.]